MTQPSLLRLVFRTTGVRVPSWAARSGRGPGTTCSTRWERGARKGPLQGFWLSPREHHTVGILRLTWKRGLWERGKAGRNEEGLGSSCVWPYFGNSSRDISSTPDPVSHLPIRPPLISIPHLFLFCEHLWSLLASSSALPWGLVPAAVSGCLLRGRWPHSWLQLSSFLRASQTPLTSQL